MAWQPIEPARLDWGEVGVPVSTAYDDVYHSADGGPGQAQHVFLAGNDLPARWAGREQFTILETGFGTGLNFLTTWTAWRDHAQRPARLHYLAVEKHPYTSADLTRIQAQWPEFAELSTALLGQWPVLVPGFQRLDLAAGQVVLTLLLGDVDSVLARLRARVDAFYLDGFDPRKNPAMWSPEVITRLARLAAPGATAATWCVAGAVRAALNQAGCVTEKRPGFGRKHEMLVGRWPGVATAATPPPRHAVILGAGLAGCSLAQRLATRGWRVDLVERHAGPAQEGSGNLAGIVRPLISRDDNIASRLNRACFLHSARAWAAFDSGETRVRRGLDGVLQIARDAGHETQQRAMAAHWPTSYVQFLEREAASQRLGANTLFGGWWFPGGGWANPPSACLAALAAANERVRLLAGRVAARLEHDASGWQVWDETGALIATAPVLILAGGASLPDWPQIAGLPLRAVRGQVTHLPEGSLPALPHAACCEGYLTPVLDGLHCLGASYAYDADDELRVAETAGNLARLARILPGAERGLEASRFGGRVGFRAATPDRLPMIGALPDPACALPRDVRLRDLPRLPGLYGLLGLGSRGLVWGALAAETLACQLNDEPLPLESDLIDAVDPGRFRLRAHRRDR